MFRRAFDQQAQVLLAFTERLLRTRRSAISRVICSCSCAFASQAASASATAALVATSSGEKRCARQRDGEHADQPLQSAQGDCDQTGGVRFLEQLPRGDQIRCDVVQIFHDL